METMPIAKIRRFMADLVSRLKPVSFSKDKSTETKSEEKIFPLKILEIADRYIVVFDRDFEHADPIAEVATNEHGEKVGFLAFGPFWVPLDEIDIKRYAGGFKMYMAGSFGLKAQVIHVYEFSGENIGKLFMFQYALKRCKESQLIAQDISS